MNGQSELDELNRVLGRRLAGIRREAGLAQVQLAARLRGTNRGWQRVVSRFEQGSAGEKKQVDEYILEPRWIQLGLDTALAQKLAGIVLARFRELAKSFPPDPRPKR